MTSKKITVSGKNLEMLEKYYKDTVSDMEYEISFSEFLCKNAIWNLESNRRVQKK